jgi:hypothetical protein
VPHKEKKASYVMPSAHVGSMLLCENISGLQKTRNSAVAEMPTIVKPCNNKASG